MAVIVSVSKKLKDFGISTLYQITVEKKYFLAKSLRLTVFRKMIFTAFAEIVRMS